jgi:Uma2 family endonuclease
LPLLGLGVPARMAVWGLWSEETGMATATRTRSKPFTLTELVKRFGAIPASRIRTNPALGLATEQDVKDADAHEDRLCELIDGVLVEKTLGAYESRVAVVIGHFFEAHRDVDDRGLVLSEAGMLRIAPGQVRIPDVSFISWNQLPGREFPGEPIPSLYPDLAVEVLSEGNTQKEISQKIREYFRSGTSLVWVIDPDGRTVRVYTGPRRSTLFREADTLDGGSVLPRFRLPVKLIFERAGKRQGR